MCLKRVPGGVLKAPEVFRSILEFLEFLESALECCQSPVGQGKDLESKGK
jgi:hypothetical protein